MLDIKVLVVKLGPIDARRARAIAVDKVAALEHEARNDAVQDRVLVSRRERGRLAFHRLVPDAELAKVLGRSGEEERRIQLALVSDEDAGGAEGTRWTWAQCH